MKKLYFIAILLPDSVEEHILQLKTEIAQKFNSVAALKPMGHITMQDTFLYEEKNLPRLMAQLEGIFSTAAPFDVELSDFGAFPAHTIFAAVKDFWPFQKLRELIFWKLRNERTFPHTAVGSRQITPHVTVAYRDLDPEKFEAAWTEFSQREFSAKFKAAAAHLMEHRGKWRTVKEFPFLSLPGNPVQGDLFAA
jgi:2'-5' RNA ligase